MPTVAHIDFETRSPVDLKKTGVDVYAEHPDTGVWCMAWCLDDGPIQIWSPGEPDPAPLLEHIASGGTLKAWNSYFEETIWAMLRRRELKHWPALAIEQIVDVMAEAYALGFPGSLDACAQALRLPIKKDEAGYRLMMMMAKPRVTWKRDNSREMWFDDAPRIEKLKAYCINDVAVERLIASKLAKHTDRERKIWLLDQKINRRGVRLDLPKIAQAQRLIENEVKALNAELQDITNGRVRSATDPAALKSWLGGAGLETSSLRKNDVAGLLKTGNTLANESARRVLEIRQEAGKSSTAKIKAMLAAASSDGRARGLFGYHVATTGRWAGRRIQPQNLPRGILSSREINDVIEMFGDNHAADLIRFSYAPPLDAVASSLRAMLVPAAGHRFIGGDFSNIEGRVLAWLANEDWKLNAFADYDGGRGADLYKLAYARSFGCSADEVTKDQRQIGKVQELALGYQGGPAAFLSMAANYNANIAEITEATIAAAGLDAWNDHLEWLARWERTAQLYGRLSDKLSFNQWAALRYIVDRWRSAHPNVKAFWHDLEDCAMRAVERPGTVVPTESGKIQFCRRGSILFARLPSSRCLAYPYPQIGPHEDPDTKERRTALFYWGWNGISRRWDKSIAYGGLLAENVTQAVARDILADAMLRLEEADLPIVLHVHDEVLSEVPISHPVTVELYENIMCSSERWANGLPVAAEAWTGERYAKA